MGIIQKQAVTGTIYSYIGVVIGFITVSLIFPHILSTEEIGLLKLLVSFSLLFAQFGTLGFVNVINRLFPFFRNQGKGHGGFITVAIIIAVIGFIITVLALEISRPVIVRNNMDDSALFLEYFNYLYPLIFFTLFFGLFDNYIKVLYDAVIGLFLKELLQRFLILAFIGLYFFNLLSFHDFVILYVIALSVPTLIIFIHLLVKGEIILTIPGKVFNPDMWKEVFHLCLHGLIAGFGSVIILQLDSIMVNRYLGISATGIYATTFFFAAIILVPSRALIKISTTVVAEAWKANDLETINVIYRKSCLTQAIIGLIIFIGLWVNIDNIFKIIPEEYAAGKWVIFFVGLKNVVDMATGMNNIILQTSKNYKLYSLFVLIFIILLVFMFILFIPLLGLTGAALSIFLSFTVYTFIRYMYLKIKYGMEPFDRMLLLVLAIAIVSYLAGYFIPVSRNFVSDIVIRSIVTGGVYALLIVFLRVSEDINTFLNQIFRTDIFWKNDN